MPYEELDPEAVTTALVTCMTDRGWPVERIGATGIGRGEIPSEQAAAAEADLNACTAGLNLPTAGLPSNEYIVGFFEELLVTKACLEELGYDIEEPPSLDTFVESYATGPWHPYLSLPLDAPIAEIERACPQP